MSRAAVLPPTPTPRSDCARDPFPTIVRRTRYRLAMPTTAARPRPTWSNRGGRVPLKILALLSCIAVLSIALVAERPGHVDPRSLAALLPTASLGVLAAGMVLVMTTPLAGLWLAAAGAGLACAWTGAPWPLLALAGVLTGTAVGATVPVLLQLSASRGVLANRKTVTPDAATADALLREHPGRPPRTVRLIVAALAAGVAAFALTKASTLAGHQPPGHLVWGIPAMLVPLLTLRWRASRKRRVLHLAYQGGPGLHVTLRGAGDKRILLDGGPHLAAVTGYNDETLHLVGVPPGRDTDPPPGTNHIDLLLAGGRPEPGIVLGLRTADDTVLIQVRGSWLAGRAPRDADREMVTGKIVPAGAVDGVDVPPAPDGTAGTGHTG